VKKLIPLLICGCFKLPEDLSQVDTRLIPFDNNFVNVDDAVIQSFETTMLCPDESPATFHMVYRTSTTEPAPVVILLHSGAFDYVMDPGEDGPLSGRHYHADSRLSGEFATRKVWETLGLQIDDLDLAEDNQGTLPAAFINRGAVLMLPGNCWGDLWRNDEESQPNDLDLDGFVRNGRAFASWMTQFLTDPELAESQNIAWPTNIDGSQIHAVGLGDGGRGVLELLEHSESPTFAGAAVDSVPDRLAAYFEQPADFEDEIEGIERLFEDETAIQNATFVNTQSLPDRFYFLWSSADTQMPISVIRPAATALRNLSSGVKVKNATIQGHVLSNSDMLLAEEMADFLLGSTAETAE
jgi:hypothetical protein